MGLYSYVRISGPGKNYKIGTGKRTSGEENGVLVEQALSLYEAGQSKTEVKSRSSGEGSVLPATPLIHGKTFTINLIFYAKDPKVCLKKYHEVAAFCLKNTLTIQTEHGSIANCQAQAAILDSADFQDRNSSSGTDCIIRSTFTFASEDAFFNFT